MAKLIYVLNVSLDGYIADEDGKFDWTVPDEEFFSFVNDLERPVGTYLYGRRLYELMHVWETDPAAAPQSPAAREFAEIWQAADKVVYSRTLATASTTRTRIERDFDPQAVRPFLPPGADQPAPTHEDLWNEQLQLLAPRPRGLLHRPPAWACTQ
jgi:dihydrofolate reductase